MQLTELQSQASATEMSTNMHACSIEMSAFKLSITGCTNVAIFHNCRFNSSNYQLIPSNCTVINAYITAKAQTKPCIPKL